VSKNSLACRFARPTIPIRIHDNPPLFIDSPFEKDYTHFIEVTPSCAYFMEYPVLSSDTRGSIRVYFLFSLKKGDSYNGFRINRQVGKGKTIC